MKKILLKSLDNLKSPVLFAEQYSIIQINITSIQLEAIQVRICQSSQCSTG